MLVLSSLFITSAFAQKKGDKDVVEEWNKTTSKTFYGISLYTDIAGPITSMFKDGKTDFSFGVDADICHTIYPTFECADEYASSHRWRRGISVHCLS